MNHASLFSGIGGFEIAAEWMGWKNVLSCEYDPFCSSVLRHHFPDTHHYENIKQLDAMPYRGTIDVLTGGFPCQPFSAAGKRKGTEDNRFLWPEMLRIIQEIQPTWVIAENVRGIVSQGGGMVFERVCAEMEADGYEVQPFCIPACAVGAPHRRERMWFVAHSDARRIRRHEREGTQEGATARGAASCDAADSDERRQQRSGVSGIGNIGEEKLRTSGRDQDAGNADDEGLERHAGNEYDEEGREESSRFGRPSNWSESWFQAAARLCSMDDGIPRELDGNPLFGFYPNNRGKPSRSAWRTNSLKAYGNAIVPPVAFQIFKAIEAAEMWKRSGKEVQT